MSIVLSKIELDSNETGFVQNKYSKYNVQFKEIDI